GDRAAAGGQQAYRKVQGLRPGVPLGHARVGDGHARVWIIIDDRAERLGGSRRGAAQIDEISFVRLVGRVAIHLHGNWLGGLAWIERQRARGRDIIAPCQRRAVGRRVVDDDRLGGGARQGYGEYRIGRAAVSFHDRDIADRDLRIEADSKESRV